MLILTLNSCLLWRNITKKNPTPLCLPAGSKEEPPTTGNEVMYKFWIIAEQQKTSGHKIFTEEELTALPGTWVSLSHLMYNSKRVENYCATKKHWLIQLHWEEWTCCCNSQTPMKQFDWLHICLPVLLQLLNFESAVIISRRVFCDRFLKSGVSHTCSEWDSIWRIHTCL